MHVLQQVRDETELVTQLPNVPIKAVQPMGIVLQGK